MAKKKSKTSTEYESKSTPEQKSLIKCLMEAWEYPIEKQRMIIKFVKGLSK